jgi:hypothetical protein
MAGIVDERLEVFVAFLELLVRLIRLDDVVALAPPMAVLTAGTVEDVVVACR